MSAAAVISQPVVTTKPSGLLRRTFTFPAMLGSLLMLLSVLTVRTRFDDPDMWWHLKTGEIIWNTHAIPKVDLFSFSARHQAVIPHEWLSQLSIYAAYKLDGESGMMLWLCILTGAIVLAGYRLCAVYGGNAKVAFVGALAIWLFSTIGLAVRPQMIGYLLLTLEFLVIHKGRTCSPRWFYWLPPIFALWVNCHGSFFLGMSVAVVILVSSMFHFQIGSLVAVGWERQRQKTFIYALALSAAALFLNPGGVRQIFYPVNTMLHQPINLASVQEWQPLQLGDARGVACLVIVGIILLFGVMRKAQILWDELLLLTFGVWMAASHVRMLFVFGIVAAPILSRVLSASWEGYNAEKDHPALNALFISASVAAMFYAFPNPAMLAAQVNEHSPVKAVEYIRAHHLAGRMLNEYVFGGYLIWAAPDYPVMMDGRADVYEWAGVLSEFGNWVTLRSARQPLLDKYGINVCLLARDSPMAIVLPLDGRWKLIYSDDNSVIIVRAKSIADAGNS